MRQRMLTALLVKLPGGLGLRPSPCSGNLALTKKLDCKFIFEVRMRLESTPSPPHIREISWPAPFFPQGRFFHKSLFQSQERWRMGVELCLGYSALQGSPEHRTNIEPDET